MARSTKDITRNIFKTKNAMNIKNDRKKMARSTKDITRNIFKTKNAMNIKNDRKKIVQEMKGWKIKSNKIRTRM